MILHALYMLPRMKAHEVTVNEMWATTERKGELCPLFLCLSPDTQFRFGPFAEKKAGTRA